MSARYLPQTLLAVHSVLVDRERPCDAARQYHINYENLMRALRKFRARNGIKRLVKLIDENT